jgi:alpha-glucoside transport system permease protein
MATVDSAVPVRGLTRSERIVRVLTRTPIHIVLVGLSLIWLVPTVGLALTSFRKPPAIASSGWWHSLTQWDWTLHNYGAVIHSTGMGHAWVNSLIITIPATLLPLTLGALAAYGFAWVRFPFRDTLFLTIVALMIVPIQTSLVPLLKLFREWHMNTPHFGIGAFSFVGIWVAHTAFGLPLAVFLLRNFFITLPKDLIEAARMDGASNLAIFRRIVVPLSVPALASFAIFQFLWVWNDLLMALIFLSGQPDKAPMTVRIPYLLSTYGQEYNLLSAAAFLLMFLPLIVFFALQRYFVQGLLAGSVKT